MLSQHEAKLYFNLPATNCSCPLVVHEIAFCYPKNATIRTSTLPCSHLHKLSLKSVLEIEKGCHRVTACRAAQEFGCQESIPVGSG